ncbi:MAG: rhodanese-like domain-containing protein [Verrucomicrobiota bacterium]|nr:rhodanese-like domain-containing protein [Verrucomicrobiota bacterium]
MHHTPGFLALVNEAKKHIQEITVAELRARLELNPQAVLVDVREDHEWQAGHAQGAVHLSRGIFERDLERRFPDKETELILYCGGGYRSALAADAAQRMGYRRVASLMGGYRALLLAEWPIVTEPNTGNSDASEHHQQSP